MVSTSGPPDLISTCMSEGRVGGSLGFFGGGVRVQLRVRAMTARSAERRNGEFTEPPLARNVVTDVSQWVRARQISPRVTGQARSRSSRLPLELAEQTFGVFMIELFEDLVGEREPTDREAALAG